MPTNTSCIKKNNPISLIELNSNGIPDPEFKFNSISLQLKGYYNFPINLPQQLHSFLT